ncbi:MAG TPA: hypothetical protein PLL88_00355 [Anaerolineaceae bacterium]|nr:hypothetical protein [Anaerolineaceae bacterium]
MSYYGGADEVALPTDRLADGSSFTCNLTVRNDVVTQLSLLLNNKL